MNQSLESTATDPRRSSRRLSGHNVGTLLAVLAACISLLEAFWPGSAPQALNLTWWLPLAVLGGCAFLLAAFIADKHQVIARALLLIGGLGLLGSGLYFGLANGGGARSLAATIADCVPGLLALVASFIIGPIRRGAFP